MRNTTVHIIIYLCVLCLTVIVAGACSSSEDQQRTHYFLKGYDQLEFRDTLGNPAAVSEYIYSMRNNGYQSYGIKDSSLVLVYKRSGEPYSGYIRTFHRNRYNLQGEFEDGKMFRLRFWYPNRTLGMDADFRSNSLSIWNSSGSIVVYGDGKETYYYYPGSQDIKQITSDTMRSYFAKSGEVERYTVYRDTAIIDFDGNGRPLSVFPYKQGRGLHGTVKQWHPNGELKMTGAYKNGKQVGTWIEYDSLGNEVNREVYNQ